MTGKVNVMFFIILYALAVITFGLWVLGWSLWHSYRVISRFFTARNHERRVVPQFFGRTGEALPPGGGHGLFTAAHFHAGKNNCPNLSL
jgi:hypothetical protein